MAKKKTLTFMNSLRHYIVTNGICEFELQDIYNMVCRNLYFGAFQKIMNELKLMLDIKYIDRHIHKNVNYFDDGTGTTVLSALDSKDCVKRFFENNHITYHFKDNVHHIEIKEYPCNVLCRGKQAGYCSEWIKIATMVIDCSFSFNHLYHPLSFSYKVDRLDPQDRYNNVKDFENLYTVLLQPDFQEDISMLVVTSGINGNVVSKRDVFISLKFIQRISEEILAGTCNYIVAPVKRYEDEDKNDSIAYDEVLKKIVDAAANDRIALGQISRHSGVAIHIVFNTLKWLQQELNKK